MYLVGAFREELVSEWLSNATNFRNAQGKPGSSAGISPAGAAQLGGCGDVGSAAVDFANATTVAAASMHADEPVAAPAPGYHDCAMYPEMNIQVAPRNQAEDVAREQEPPHYSASACVWEGAIHPHPIALH